MENLTHRDCNVEKFRFPFNSMLDLVIHFIISLYRVTMVENIVINVGK